MARKWLVGTNTAKVDGPSFNTKREAIEYGRRYIDGIFIVWKADISQAQKEKNGARLRAWLRDTAEASS